MFPRVRLARILQVFLPLLMSACSPLATPGPLPLTQAALTVGAAFTQVAQGGQWTRTAVALGASEEVSGVTPADTASLVEIASPLPQSAAPTCYQLRFEADVTLPDDTPVQPGATLVKTWRVLNTGSCPWTSDTQVVFVSGDRMGGPLAQPIGQAVAVGGETLISVTLVAPSQPGTYLGYWMLLSPGRTRFGYGPAADRAFWVEIVVLGTPAGSATATQTLTATPSPTARVTASNTPILLVSATPTLASSPTPTLTPTATPCQTSTSTPSSSPTPTP
jgi:hypothetical protein